MQNHHVWKILLFAALLPLALSGCAMFAPVEELYALPRLPDEYEALREQISVILSEGAEYAAPQAGTNLQPVQMIDLDGDGIEEALAFFRSTSEGHALRVCIFRATEEGYEQVSMIDGSGASVHSIRYVDMDGSGVKEILISWKISTDVQALSVYALEDMAPVELMSAAYARFEVADMDDDGEQEIVLLRSDVQEPGITVADYYDWDGGSLTPRSSARLSMTLSELQWMQTGRLESGETAVFVTGRSTGVEETSRSITDILIHQDQELKNIVLNDSTGISSEVFRFVNLQPGDIDGNGATEVPMPALLPPVEQGEPGWKIYWRGYSSDGSARRQAITYHNLTDSWYFMVPDSWNGHFTVQQNNAGSTEHTTTFYRAVGNRVGEELFTVYTLTGSRREEQAESGGREILARQASRIYAVHFCEGYQDWRYAIEKEEFFKRFNLIIHRWSTADN